MSVLPIYTYGAPVLRKKARPIAAASDDILRLVLDMFETMHKAQGIGLAATQVGSLERVLVIDLSEMEGYEEFKPLTVINPEVVTGGENWTMEEGCLSIPDVRGDVERPGTIGLKYRDANFREQELEASGLLGRVLLHEIDHLNGVLFIDHMPPALRSVHEEKLKKIEKGELEVGYPIVTAQNQMV
jgi:peptide deformylase